MDSNALTTQPETTTSLAELFQSAPPVPHVGGMVGSGAFRPPLLIVSKNEFAKKAVFAIDFQDGGEMEVQPSPSLFCVLVGEGYSIRSAYRKGLDGKDELFCKGVNEKPTADNPMCSSCFSCQYAKFDETTGRPFEDSQGGKCRVKQMIPMIMIDPGLVGAAQIYMCLLVVPPTSRANLRKYYTGLVSRSARVGKRAEEMVTVLTAEYMTGRSDFTFGVIKAATTNRSVTEFITDPAAQIAFVQAYQTLVDMLKNRFENMPTDVDDIAASHQAEAVVEASSPLPTGMAADKVESNVKPRKAKPVTDASTDDPDKMGTGLDEDGNQLPF